MIKLAFIKLIRPIIHKSLLILVLIFCIVFFLALAINLWGNYKQTFDQTQELLILQSRLLERSITRTFESVESSVLSIESSLASEQLLAGLSSDTDPLLITDALRQKVDQMLHFAPHIRQVIVTEGKRIILDSASRGEGFNVDFNQLGLDNNLTNTSEHDQGLAFFSRASVRFLPLEDENLTSTQHTVLVTGLRAGRSNVSGEPYRIIVALNPGYFMDFFLSDIKDSQSSLLLNVKIIDFNADVLVSLTADTTEDPPIQSFLQSGLNQQYISTENAVHSLISSTRYPLILSVSEQKEAIINRWWQKNISIFFWLSGLMILLVVIGIFMLYEFRRRLLIQDQMAALTRAVDQSQAAIILTDSAQNIEYVNPSFENMFGYDVESLKGKNPRILASGETEISVIESLRRALQLGDNWQGELINRSSEGDLIIVSTHVSSVVDESGSISHYVAVIDDITERRQVEDDLQLAASVFNTANEGILITNTDGTVVNVNEAFTRITGYSRDEILGQNPHILSSGIQGKKFYSKMWSDLFDKGCWYGEIWNRRKNGEVYAEMLSISAVKNTDGVVQHFVAMFSDITSIKQYQDKLEHIAHFDALTNLPNRVLLSDRLHQAMSQMCRIGKSLAVVFIDLDGFKSVNDHYGHENGDELLKIISQRMKNTLRSGDTLARIGGDEFFAVLLNLPNIKASEPMLTRLLSAASEPVHLGDNIVQVSASLGVTYYPQEEHLDADQLQRQADQGMYQAKLAGKNRYHVFDELHDRSVRGHLEKIEAITHALTNNEFALYYQPKVNMRTGKVVGAEALIRWVHPQKGVISPAEFLPIIEDHQLSIDIGEWVIDAALTQMEQWYGDGLEIPVSVNVGALQLQQANFIDRLKVLLSAHASVSPRYLSIEVLETSALEDIVKISGVIEACHELGVAFALDDFGTGYSSLTYLKRLSVKMLKIDKSFVRDMLYDRDDLSILEGVIGLANAFSHVVIAEGVETIEHGEMLLQLGCELAQGFGIAHPMPAHQVRSWIESWSAPSSWLHCRKLGPNKLKMLHAVVEHRAWILALERFLKRESSYVPVLDCRQCNFAQWLEDAHRTSQVSKTHYAKINLLHQQVHQLAEKLYQLGIDDNFDEALPYLGEIYDLRDELIYQINTELRENN